ncbi:MAG: Pantothenic acid transporter PanT [Firmicutes bacterium ADurb.Bin182]|nr:MAG: Pantothenic acid transporter PanT [Firmicutes bacterium ADurb.Bin182]
MNTGKIHKMVLYALFIAIVLVLGLTPLGFINLPIASVTTVHIPVIIAAYCFGVKGGALMGFFFGLTSLIRCFTTPDAVAAIILGTNTGFGFYNVLLIILILFMPRILTGIFPALVFKGISKFDKTKLGAMSVSAFTGSMTNTVFFLGSLYLFAYEQAAEGFGLVNYTPVSFIKVLLGIVAFNGVLEALTAVIICTAVGKAILIYLDKKGLSFKE